MAYIGPTDMDTLMKTAGRFGWGSLSFDELISRFDVARFPDYDNMTEPYISYIFMSRPSLNLSNGNLEVLKNHPMTSLFMNDPYGYELFKTMTDRSSIAWLPIVTNRAMSYQVSDFNLKTVDKGATFYGHTIKYGKHSEEHKVGGTFSMDFRNDRQLSILKMMYLWMSYIYIISRSGDIVPTPLHEETGILDYAASLYYVVVRRNMREIVYVEKLVGIFPISLPFSIFNYNNNYILQDTISIDFAYGIRTDPLDPEIFVDIDYLSGLNSAMIQKYSASTLNQYNVEKTSVFNQQFRNRIVQPNQYEVPFTLGTVLAKCPYVHMVKSRVDDSIHYYLRFLN